MGSDRPKVFVLEDDDDSRDALADLLEAAFRVQAVTAATVAKMEAAMELVLTCSLALLDINLGAGEASGIDAYHSLVEHGFKGRVVFVTGHGQDHPLVRTALGSGNADMIPKPLNLGHLRRLIEGLA